GPRRPPRLRRGSRRQGAATPCEPPGQGGPGRDGLAGPPPGWTDPGGRPGQPARPRGAVRRDDRRRARLPPRGREHARHRPLPDRARAGGVRLGATAPGARHLVGATVNDVRGQMAAIRDLGTLPADTDLDAVIADLGLDRPPVDPTTLTPDELVGEIQRLVKGLLGYGARLPKDLMLFVKNLVF